MAGKTLYDKLWEAHEVKRRDDGSSLIYIDRHIIHEVTSPQAFEGLRLANRTAHLLRERGATDVPALGPEALDARDDWLGATYGDPTPASVAMVRAAAAHGMELEPVYTGKALAAIADLGARLDGPVLWLNTHGPR